MNCTEEVEVISTPSLGWPLECRVFFGRGLVVLASLSLTTLHHKGQIYSHGNLIEVKTNSKFAVVWIRVWEFLRVELGRPAREGSGVRGPLKSQCVLQHVPFLIHCLGWTKSPRASDTISDCLMARRFWPRYAVRLTSAPGAQVVCVLRAVSKWENEKERWGGVKLTFPKNDLLLWLNMQWQLKFNTFPL